jgi:hypothetical protein
MKTHDTNRDEGLGSALRGLDVPEHDDAFFAELERRLSAPPRRRRAFRRPRHVRSTLALAGGACLALVLFLALGLPHLRGGADVARAAEIRAAVLRTLAGTQTIRGDLVYSALDVRTGKTTTTHQSFAEDARGDLRLTNADGSGDLAYDAARGVERSITTSASMGTGRFYAERVGLAPGPPDQGPADFIVGHEVGAVVRALAAAHSARVADVSYGGRAAWKLDTPVTPNTVFADVDQVQITVDRETGFPVHVLTTLHGAFRSELTVDHLVVDPALPADEFAVQFPAGAEVLRTDAGFVHADRARAAGIVGYQPLLPSAVPDGFRLDTIAVARETASTGPGGSNPPSRNVVSAIYRRGLDAFVVTTRQRVAGTWSDPFAVEGIDFASEQVSLPGAAAASLVLDSRTVPHVWALTDRLVVTVSGDLDRAQLLGVARSLR